ncbi:radical SAM protein [Acaryochloris marina NIES-2412]|uniref:radical SAM protein n=1 Tax=Acaryochloris marina TaxID=155978 RepID=UPI004058DD85
MLTQNRQSSQISHPSLFIPYQPKYSPLGWVKRNFIIARAFLGAITIVFKSRLQKQSLPFGASVEITDRCNAGCHYCYVYPSDWKQTQRVKGYLQLAPAEHKAKDQAIYQTLDQLSHQGMVLATLVGGEPTLAPRVIQYAGRKFPVVWVVTNGSGKFPKVPRSVVYSVSIDGPPDHHNQTRDPLGFFKNHTYQDLHGMAAAIVRNINESERGAYAHITLTKSSLDLFPETVEWLVTSVTKLRGIMVSGAATQSPAAPNTLTLADRQTMKEMIEAAAAQYGWDLFPFNQPAVNSYLFDAPFVIQNATQCTVARRVTSLGFDGQSVGKCILRDATDCQTCVCNLTGLMRGVATADRPSLKGLYQACLG